MGLSLGPLGLGLPSPLLGKRACSLTPDLALFAKYGQPGFLFNFAHTDRTFQEATGQTLADDAGEAVALALDEAQWGGKTLAQLVAAQPEIVVNGGFDTDTGWTKGECWVISGGVASRTTASSFSNLTPNPQIAATVGRTYLIETVVSATNGTATVTIDSVSVKEIPGYHGIESGSTGARPTRQAGGLLRGDGVDDNLLTTLNPAATFTMAIRYLFASVPASSQVLMASQNAIVPDRAFLALDGGTGKLRAGFGTNGSLIVGPANRAGLVTTVILVWNGTNATLYQNGSIVSTVSQGAMVSPTTIPLRLFANNNNGAGANFFGGDIYQALAIQSAITPAEALSLSNYWNSL